MLCLVCQFQAGTFDIDEAFDIACDEQGEGIDDLDVLVEFADVPGMLKFLDLERDLSHLLGVPVDLVQKEALKPSIGKRILEEVLSI